MSNNKKNKRNNHAVRKTVNRLVSHASVILSLIVLICFILDKFNDAMAFISSNISKWLIGVAAFVAILNGILTIISLWEKPKKPGIQEIVDSCYTIK